MDSSSYSSRWRYRFVQGVHPIIQSCKNRQKEQDEAIKQQEGYGERHTPIIIFGKIEASHNIYQR